MEVNLVYMWPIGQKQSNCSLPVCERDLKEAGAMDYTIIVAANASDSSALQF